MEEKKTDAVQDGREATLPFLMDRARVSVNNCVFSLMERYGIPPEMMYYILKDILLDVSELRVARMCAMKETKKGV